jgi:hypothetical protein
MNCKGLAKVLPELVAGELDERIVRKAEEHIRVCPICASERAAYEEALSALCAPRPMVEVPDALATLELPEVYVRKTWVRPVFASVAMAAVLGLVMILPRTHQPLAPTAPAVKAPRIAETIEHFQPAPTKPSARVEIAQSIPRAGTEHKTHASKTRPERASLLADARLGLSDVPTQPRHAESRYAADRVAEAVSSEENQVLVIATDVEPSPEPSAMSIESKDESTGVLVAYDFSRDETGMEQVMELTTNYLQGESGGN